MGIVPTPESDRARFWAKVDKFGPVPEARPELGPCWLWTAALFDNGYGAFRLGAKQRRAHVVSHEWHIGPTVGLQVCHACDRRHCVNPAHLFLGTQKENIQDALSKGRMATGQRSGMYTQGLTTLTDDQVREINCMLNEGVLQREIAERFGVGQTMVSHIASGKAWGHVTGRRRIENAKLRPNADTVRAIRQAADDGIPKSEIAALYNLSQAAVYRIANREVYAGVVD